MGLLKVKADIIIINSKREVVAAYQTYLPQKNSSLSKELYEMIWKSRHKYGKYPVLRQVSYNATELKFVKTDLTMINRLLNDLVNIKELYGVSISANNINQILMLAGRKTDGSSNVMKIIKSLYNGQYVQNGNKVQFNLNKRHFFLDKTDPIFAMQIDAGSYHKKHYEISDRGAFYHLMIDNNLDSASFKTILNEKGWQIVEKAKGFEVITTTTSVRKAAKMHVAMGQYYDLVRTKLMNKESIL